LGKSYADQLNRNAESKGKLKDVVIKNNADILKMKKWVSDGTKKVMMEMDKILDFLAM